MFQSKLVPVRCCPARQHWTKWAKIVQWYSTRLKTVYQTYLKRTVFLQKYMCALWANIVQVIFLWNVVSDIFGQHLQDNIPRQRYSTMVGTTLYWLSSWWKLYFSHGPTFHKHFSYAMLAQIDPDKIVDYFSVQSCLWTLGHHYTGKFLVQCYRQIRQHCISYFPAKTCLRALGQYWFSCAMLCQTYMDNID